jgi:hypothetical protein
MRLKGWGVLSADLGVFTNHQSAGFRLKKFYVINEFKRLGILSADVDVFFIDCSVRCLARG